MWARLRALTRVEGTSLELVLVANAAVALIAGGWVFWSFHTALRDTLLVCAGTFVVLGACLLSRRTLVVPAAAGGLFAAGLLGAFGFSFGLRVNAVLGWVGAAVGAAAGLAAAYFAYGDVLKGHRERNEP